MNKIMLTGNAGRDPEVSYTPSGSAVAKFSLAVNRKWNDKNTGERREETTWFNIVAWERHADFCSQYVHKGSKLFVEGRVVIRDYTDRDNVQRRAVDVILENVELLDSRPRDGAASGGATAGGAAAGGATAGGPDEVGGEDFPF